MSASGERDGLVFRQDYFADPEGWRAIAELLRDVFGVDISPLDRLGGHDTTNMPSAWFDADGRCVANFSAFSMPLIINGKVVKAAGLQSGAVRPEYRGRGLFRDLIRMTLARCDARGYEAIALYTDKPGLYEPYDFRIVPQHRFSGPPPQPLESGRASRRVDIGDADDLALMQGLLGERLPVSARFAVTDQAKMFLLNAYLVDDVTLDYLPAYQAVVAWRSSPDGAFELLDIAGPEIPPLNAILAALAQKPARVIVRFPPDRLSWLGEPERDTGDLVLMMRCPAAMIPTEPFCLSPMAEF